MTSHGAKVAFYPESEMGFFGLFKPALPPLWNSDHNFRIICLVYLIKKQFVTDPEEAQRLLGGAMPTPAQVEGLGTFIRQLKTGKLFNDQQDTDPVGFVERFLRE